MLLGVRCGVSVPEMYWGCLKCGVRVCDVLYLEIFRGWAILRFKKLVG